MAVIVITNYQIRRGLLYRTGIWVSLCRKVSWAAKVVDPIRQPCWLGTHRSTLCEKHFEETCFNQGKQRKRLKWKLNPVPTIYSGDAKNKPSLLPVPNNIRKPPTTGIFQRDQLHKYTENFSISSFELSKSYARKIVWTILLQLLIKFAESFWPMYWWTFQSCITLTWRRNMPSSYLTFYSKTSAIYTIQGPEKEPKQKNMKLSC